MPQQTILKTIEFKLYLNAVQEATLTEWFGTCCWLYNKFLEHRKKAYKRRGESVSIYKQQGMLTEWRKRMKRLNEAPVHFLRNSLRRLNRNMNGFFARVKDGTKKPGYPHFRPAHRYNSIECLDPANYLGDGAIWIPKMGWVRARGQFEEVPGEQRLLRIMRRPSGWYAQVVFPASEIIPPKVEPKTTVGIDMGLASFLTTSEGEKVESTHYYRQAQRSLRRFQRKIVRCCWGSNNRKKAVHRYARQHERIAARRRDFAHQTARKLVNRFDLIGFEKLSIMGLSRTRVSKAVHDAAWGMFLRFVACKAESAGKWAVPVDPRGTSQTCPWCGAVQYKSLSERTHQCACNPGVVIDRDHASGLVILARALRAVGALACEGPDHFLASNGGVSRAKAAGSPSDAVHCEDTAQQLVPNGSRAHDPPEPERKLPRPRRRVQASRKPQRDGFRQDALDFGES